MIIPAGSWRSTGPSWGPCSSHSRADAVLRRTARAAGRAGQDPAPGAGTRHAGNCAGGSPGRTGGPADAGRSRGAAPLAPPLSLFGGRRLQRQRRPECRRELPARAATFLAGQHAELGRLRFLPTLHAAPALSARCGPPGAHACSRASTRSRDCRCAAFSRIPGRRCRSCASASPTPAASPRSSSTAAATVADRPWPDAQWR